MYICIHMYDTYIYRDRQRKIEKSDKENNLPGIYRHGKYTEKI